MTVLACAEQVRRGDPDRFLAAMAAPPAARAVLFPLYAFTLEVARAPWVTKEPLIAEMRLQWWRDALDEIAARGLVRRHEVTTPLAQAIDADGARLLHATVEARRWDIEGRAFADAGALHAHIDATAAIPMWVAARALGAPPADETAVRAWGAAEGLTRWFQAVPALEAAGLHPLHDGRPAAVARLARTALADLSGARVSRAAAPATLAAWQARPLLRLAARAPHRVADGTLALSEAGRRARLLIAQARGRP
ncbi:phytoene synthase [Rhodobacteraceae bacterium CCMM004]|nr:phytoene synthase [Rhodobacteraceae bacterium CCMM004]